MPTTKTIKTPEEIQALLVANPGRVFVRWSRGPAMDRKQGQSRDYQSGGSHSGLSAVQIDEDWFGYTREHQPNEWYLRRRLREYGFLRMKDSKIRCWIMVGQIVGKDSDGYESIEITGECYRVADALLEE
ncbi:MAG TPA: DUF6098 family protein [Caulifigura sp.]|jgi:hypothetical protein|nr:DUF6098 family protein [Caulifigura sp.]